jgi:uroporphyrinogen-III decarboxylase
MYLEVPEREFFSRIKRYAEQDVGDVDNLPPGDPLSDECWSVLLRAGRFLLESMGRVIAVIGSSLSPFFVATELSGYDNLMMDTFTSPDVVERIIKVVFESLQT